MHLEQLASGNCLPLKGWGLSLAPLAAILNRGGADAGLRVASRQCVLRRCVASPPSPLPSLDVASAPLLEFCVLGTCAVLCGGLFPLYHALGLVFPVWCPLGAGGGVAPRLILLEFFRDVWGNCSPP